VVGFLDSGSETSANARAAFNAGLKQSGFVEGQNLTIEYRRAEGKYERLPEFAADLVRHKVSVIYAAGSVVSPLAAKAATTTIPIVFVIGADPVQIGLVASINRPGGNITGITTLGSDIVRKQFEILHELLPGARAFAALVNPDNPTHGIDKSRWTRIAEAVRVPIETVSASRERDFEPAIAGIADKPIDGLYVAGDTFFAAYRHSLIDVLARHQMPAMFTARQNVLDGGLISYGGSLGEALHNAGFYTGRILKGDKPADLPVLRSTKFDLSINLRTAKALGLTVADSLFMQATDLIE
jgi:putative ABC transport system substrate-binding protein